MCDPRRSILSVSNLYCGFFSDNDICVKSGFCEYLESLMQREYLHPGDSIMADKGFRIKDKLAENLKIPPFATSAHSMSAANYVNLTRKVATHRIHMWRGQLIKLNVLNFSVEKSLSVYCTLILKSFIYFSHTCIFMDIFK